MKSIRCLRQFVRILACLVCLTVLLTACGAAPQITASDSASASNAHGGRAAPPLMWQLQPEGFVHDTPAGPFHFLYVLDNFNVQRTLLFYALPGEQREVPQVMSQTPGTKVLSVQKLGMVGAFQVGVIDLQWHDQISQTVSLAFVLPTSKATWTMAPLKQTGQTMSGGMQGQGMPDSVARKAPIEALNYGNKRGIADLEIAPAKGQPHQPSLFVVVERDNTVSLVSEDEFRRFSTPMPITTGPINPQPTAELPPATYAPTPTLPPYPSPEK